MLSLNSTLSISITQVRDSQSFWRKSSRIVWNNLLSSSPHPDPSPFPASSAPLFHLLSLTSHFSNSVISPSCSSAGTRPKLINLSELISLVSPLSYPAPHLWCWHISLLYSLTSWELSRKRMTAMTQENQKLLCSIIPYPCPEKPSLFFLISSWPLCSLTLFWLCTTKNERLFNMLTPEFSDIKNAEVCYASI